MLEDASECAKVIGIYELEIAGNLLEIRETSPTRNGQNPLKIPAAFKRKNSSEVRPNTPTVTQRLQRFFLSPRTALYFESRKPLLEFPQK